MAKTDDLVFSPKVKATTKTVPASTHDIASSKGRTPSWNATAGSWKGQCKGKRSSSKLNGIVLLKTPANNGILHQLSKANVAVPVALRGFVCQLRGSLPLGRPWCGVCLGRPRGR